MVKDVDVERRDPRETSSLDQFRVVVPVEVRFRDTDAMGHVNNAIYLTYFEVARQHYWKRLTGLKSYSDIDFILAHASIDFRSPAFVGETLQVGLRASEMRNSSFVFEYLILEAASQRVVATGKTVQVMYDYEMKRSKPLSPELREKIERLEGGGEAI